MQRLKLHGRNQTAAAYGITMRPTLFTGSAASVANAPPLERPIPISFSSGHVLVHRQMVQSPHLLAAIAQGLGARVLGYESYPAGSATLTQLQAINAKAVEILVRVRKMDTGQAVRLMADYIAAAGPRTACPQLEDLRRGHPSVSGLVAAPDCVNVR